MRQQHHLKSSLEFLQSGKYSTMRGDEAKEIYGGPVPHLLMNASGCVLVSIAELLRLRTLECSNLGDG